MISEYQSGDLLYVTQNAGHKPKLHYAVYIGEGQCISITSKKGGSYYSYYTSVTAFHLGYKSTAISIDSRSIHMPKEKKEVVASRTKDDIGNSWAYTEEEWANYCLYGIKPADTHKSYILPAIGGAIGFGFGGGLLGTIGGALLGKELNTYLHVR